jgi:hypothetical protein
MPTPVVPAPVECFLVAPFLGASEIDSSPVETLWVGAFPNRARSEVVSEMLRSEAYEHRLGFQLNAPELFHAFLDVIFQC